MGRRCLHRRHRVALRGRELGARAHRRRGGGRGHCRRPLRPGRRQRVPRSRRRLCCRRRLLRRWMRRKHLHSRSHHGRRRAERPGPDFLQPDGSRLLARVRVLLGDMQQRSLRGHLRRPFRRRHDEPSVPRSQHRLHGEPPMLQRALRACDRAGRSHPVPRCLPGRRDRVCHRSGLLLARLLRRRLHGTALRDRWRQLRRERGLLLRSVRPVDAAMRRRPRQFTVPAHGRRLWQGAPVGLLRRDEPERPVRPGGEVHPAAGSVPRPESLVRERRRLLLEALRPHRKDVCDSVHRHERNVHGRSRLLLVELHERELRLARSGTAASAGRRRRRGGSRGRGTRADLRDDRDRVHRRDVLLGAVPRGVLRPASHPVIGSVPSADWRASEYGHLDRDERGHRRAVAKLAVLVVPRARFPSTWPFHR